LPTGEKIVNGGSGFPAAICTVGLKPIRGWKAAPTIKPTLKVLNLIYMRTGGKQETTAFPVFSG